ncbi:hypothetical protein Tco_0496051 [Tanacetum coccineum]
MSMTIQSSVKDKILATSSETSKVENASAEMLRDLDQQMEKRADDGKANVVTDALSRKERVKPRRVRAMAMTIQYGVRGMILAAQSEAFSKEKYSQKSLSWFRSTDGQKRSESLYFMDRIIAVKVEVGDRVLLKVTPWKGIVCFGKKGKLAPRYVGPFEIFEKIGLVAYKLRLPEELSSVHDTFHVSNLKKCLMDASLHVPLDEIKIALVKVRWNSKRDPEFSWEHEDQMRIRLALPLDMAMCSFYGIKWCAM